MRHREYQLPRCTAQLRRCLRDPADPTQQPETPHPPTKVRTDPTCPQNRSRHERAPPADLLHDPTQQPQPQYHQHQHVENVLVVSPREDENGRGLLRY